MTALPYTVEQHIALKRVTSIAASPDGSWLAVAVQRLDLDGAKYMSDLWKVPADGSAATQLTRGECKDTAPCFRHDGALGFLSNRAPNESKPDEDADRRLQVWVLPAGGGEPQQITDEPLGVDSFRFARNADRLVVLAPVLDGIAHDKQREAAADRRKNGPSARSFTRQPVRHWDHWLHENEAFAYVHVIAYTAAGTDRADLTPQAGRELSIEPALDVGQDGRGAVVTWSVPGTDRELDSHLLWIELASGRSVRFDAGVNSNYAQPLLAPDGRTIAALHSTRSPKTVLQPAVTLIDLGSGATRAVAAGWDRWPHLHAWSPDGRRLWATADDGGHTPVFTIDTGAGGKVERIIAAAAGGAHDSLAVLDAERIAGIRATLLQAPECFVAAARPDSTPRLLARLSGFASPTGTAANWAEVESFTVRSTDGAPIQSFIVRPKNAKKAPTLLWIHGGPIGMSADGWHWRWNPLLAVAQGYAVVQPNPRGSTGFGREFVQGIWGNVWGDQCFKDLMAVADALEQRPDVDGARIMAMGGSFGGYMTNWIGSQTQRFRCLITHAGIVTMAQFTGVTDHPAWWYLEMGGEDPYADRERFDRFAPIRYIKNWKTPTLIIHGELDYRCPIGEALNLFEALQYHGVPSELLVFPDENHWVLKPRNIAAWYRNVLRFIERHMPAAARTAS